MSIDFEKGGGLVPVVVQHYTTGEVLMLGYGNPESMQRCEATGELWLYSRSRAQLWHKGETSGNTQRIVSITTDCDADAVLIRVAPNGPMCHTGERSCFADAPTLRALADVIRQRAETPDRNSYTNKLLADENLRLKKLGEETVELVLACKSGEASRIAEEAADLIYHTLVACAANDVDLQDILDKLEARRATRRGRDDAG
ncbi:MAG TPA: bifunctional phosphoribosyl-AMP cyclohydrolase/phosphoribosyl-ATP diphosphatase HisIE [Longimicrobiales bacterium]|nr:bifunctional phosphoribosyl-AMP cyclohydrolase/phosphoribosyl-ATP diphosphatase HisIE [Longimicrobiales bacterium]